MIDCLARGEIGQYSDMHRQDHHTRARPHDENRPPATPDNSAEHTTHEHRVHSNCALNRLSPALPKPCVTNLRRPGGQELRHAFRRARSGTCEP